MLTIYFRLFNLPGATVAEREAALHRHLIRATLLFLIGTLMPSPRWARGLAAGAGLFVVAQILWHDRHITICRLPGAS
jgi:drug/metabolite transporter superfamily protein YnfA